jgi:hypothetical protein
MACCLYPQFYGYPGRLQNFSQLWCGLILGSLPFNAFESIGKKYLASLIQHLKSQNQDVESK